jgi:hypothetical protein
VVFGVDSVFLVEEFAAGCDLFAAEVDADAEGESKGACTEAEVVVGVKES